MKKTFINYTIVRICVLKIMSGLMQSNTQCRIVLGKIRFRTWKCSTHEHQAPYPSQYMYMYIRCDYNMHYLPLNTSISSKSTAVNKHSTQNRPLRTELMLKCGQTLHPPLTGTTSMLWNAWLCHTSLWGVPKGPSLLNEVYHESLEGVLLRITKKQLFCLLHKDRVN